VLLNKEDLHVTGHANFLKPFEKRRPILGEEGHASNPLELSRIKLVEVERIVPWPELVSFLEHGSHHVGVVIHG
jgi:hypothetical protein